jgi:hypothetical protein
VTAHERSQFLDHGRASPALQRMITKGTLPVSPPPDGELPPAFSTGSYSDPIFEKASVNAATVAAYQARDAEMGFSGSHAL